MYLEKNVFSLLAITLVCSAAHILDEEWKTWKTKYEKQYKNHGEETFRRQIWEKTWQRVQKHNALAHQGLKTYTMSVNHYADLTFQDLAHKRIMSCPKRYGSKAETDEKKYFEVQGEIPEKVDWRDTGCVTPAKNEGSICEASWAFALVGVLETRYCTKNNELHSFSEQQLLDCDSQNEQCCGGDTESAFKHVIDMGLMQSKDYEYTQTSFKCLYKNDEAVRINITKYYRLRGDENIARVLAMDGPVAVSFQYSDDFLLYDGGIYSDEEDEDDKCNRMYSQSATVIGYGTDCEKDYWLIKNSWGNQWGENGYARVDRDARQCIYVIEMVTAEVGETEEK
ncbi:cathepsin L-like proteinase [Pelodytes ibericus]